MGNFIVFGIGGVISQIVPFLMIPVITRIMPSTEYYGISDLSNTVVNLGSALAVMGMYDAMYRMFFENDDEEYKKDICSTTLIFTIGTSLVVFIIMMLLRHWIANIAFGNEKYSNLVNITAITTLIGATNSIAAAPTRMQNKRKVFILMNTLSPVLAYSISIPLLLKGYYLVAMPVSMLLSALCCESIFIILNKKWFTLRRFKIKYLKPLLTIAIPLLPNFLIYWVFNSSDKLMITNLIGAGATGVYSVGAKLGHASQLIYTAFAGGWQYFAFSTMRDEHQVESNSQVFEYLGVISFFCTTIMFILSKPIYSLLFTGDYVAGFIIAPYLFLAPLLQMLFQVAANQFLVIKKTWPNLLILSLGAIVNVVLNLILIPILGIEGAAIATLVGYIISDLVCIIVLIKMKLHIITGKFMAAVFIMGIFIIAWRFAFKDCMMVSTFAAFFCCILYVLLYRHDLRMLLAGIKKKEVL